jgi:hypothetical protein
MFLLLEELLPYLIQVVQRMVALMSWAIPNLPLLVNGG